MVLCPGSPCWHLEVAAALFPFSSWQWLNHLVSRVPAGKKALLINLDGTAVCLFQGTVRGTVAVGKKRKRDLPIQRVNRATRRTYLTHAALICDNPFYQKHLPQLVIGNEHTLLVRDMPGLQGRCPQELHSYPAEECLEQCEVDEHSRGEACSCFGTICK